MRGVYIVSTRIPDQSVRLTKTVVDKIAPPARGQTFIRDVDLKGFALRITASGVRSFIVEKRVHGRVRRITLGRYGELTVEQARKQAQKTLGHIAIGIDPAAEKHRQRVQGVTLNEAYQLFLQSRKSLKPKTRYEYARLWQVAFSDWHKKPLLHITRTMIAKRHQYLGEEHGEAYANGAMRFLRSLINFARATYEDGTGHALITDNPVQILSQTRAWYRTARRQTVIKVPQLPTWFSAVYQIASVDYLIDGPSRGIYPISHHPLSDKSQQRTERDFHLILPLSLKRSDPLSDKSYQARKAVSGGRIGQDVSDYLLLLMFTGLRKQEGLTLQWQHVDLASRTLYLPDPKNHEPLTLPLSDFICQMLARRQRTAVNGYVFAGKCGKSHLIEPKNYVQQVIAISGVQFTLHDLRRTFITIAESLDIPPYTIKRLVNHKIHGDVTAGYIVSDLERLRGPMQKISDFLQRAMHISAPTPILEFAQRSR